MCACANSLSGVTYVLKLKDKRAYFAFDVLPGGLGFVPRLKSNADCFRLAPEDIPLWFFTGEQLFKEIILKKGFHHLFVQARPCPLSAIPKSFASPIIKLTFDSVLLPQYGRLAKRSLASFISTTPVDFRPPDGRSTTGSLSSLIGRFCFWKGIPQPNCAWSTDLDMVPLVAKNAASKNGDHRSEKDESLVAEELNMLLSQGGEILWNTHATVPVTLSPSVKRYSGLRALLVWYGPAFMQ
jgi:hypothetical protein